jgi:serine protease AprX
MKIYKDPSLWRIILPVLLLLQPVEYRLSGQGITYSYYYRVYIKDKGANKVSDFVPTDLLSSRAILRRQKAGIEVPDLRDIPVYKGYIDQIKSAGFVLHSTSKWMNTALFKTQSPADIKVLLNLPFVSDVKTVKIPGMKGIFKDKLDIHTSLSELPPFDRPVTMVDGYPLHENGYNGENVLIAVLDGGFTNADKIPSLSDLRNRKGILSAYDFVNRNTFIYNASTHGTAVLSILAGNIPGLIEGTAKGADYLLLKTEDVNSEFPCEEDFWAAGAEYADSAGADIITSSLGYFNFDDPTLNYKTSDLDGKTAFVTRAAEFAASKGILVVNSAGNERNSPWEKILFPSDGESVLAVGAVDGNNNISVFSSSGPSSDGRIKPDNVAMGVTVPIQTSTTSVSRGDGTSFSCPVLSGMAACLIQAVPQASNNEIINAIHSCADRFNSPDSLYGYGIPDMVKALINLQNKYTKVPDEGTIAVPNPVTSGFELIFREPPEQFSLEIITSTGKIIFRKEFSDYPGRTITISELQNREQGIYFIRLKTVTHVTVLKLIKLRD